MQEETTANNQKPFGFVLHGQPVTKKNSATIVRMGKTSRAALIPSKAYQRYERMCHEAIMMLRARNEVPHFTTGVNMCVRYYLQNRAHWPDIVGLMQATADILSDEYRIIEHKKTMTKKWLLADDRIIKSWNGTVIAGIDAANPRAEITITPLMSAIDTELDPYIRRQIAGEGNLFGDLL